MKWFRVDNVTLRNWQGFTIYLTVDSTYGVEAADGEWLGDFPNIPAAKEAVRGYNYGMMEE